MKKYKLYESFGLKWIISGHFIVGLSMFVPFIDLPFPFIAAYPETEASKPIHVKNAGNFRSKRSLNSVIKRK